LQIVSSLLAGQKSVSSLADELREICGDAVYDELAAQLENRPV